MALTKIEWTNRVWNFLAGCSLASPGCTHCYAMKQAARIARMNPELEHYRGLTQPSKAGPVWTGKIGFAEHKLTEPLRVKKPAMWFVNSMSDLFHEDVPDEVIDRAFAVMALAPQHTFQVLTKRSARMREYVNSRASLSGNIGGQAEQIILEHEATFDGGVKTSYPAKAHARGEEIIERVFGGLPNVWLGVSVEDQKRADERIPDLLATPAAVRWISAEPLLGPVDISEHLWGRAQPCAECSRDADCGCGFFPRGAVPREPALDWVVAGGESGHDARPMHPDWARSLRDQCAAAGVPFLFKQWGEFVDENQSPDEIVLPGTCHRLWGDEGPCIFRVGKTRAGRLLDGVEHNGYPIAAVRGAEKAVS